MVRIGEISAYWQKPTVAPVVQVDSPEMAEKIHRLYPYDHPRFVTDWQQSFSGFTDVKAEIPAYLMGAVLTLSLGYFGWRQRKAPIGFFLLGGASSMLATTLFAVVKDLVK